MSRPIRIPITAITTVGVTLLLLISVGSVLYLGFGQAANSTRDLWANQSDTLITAIEESLQARFQPIVNQSRAVAENVRTLADISAYDEFIFGTMASTPQVLGVAFVTPEGKTRQWIRGSLLPFSNDWSSRPEVMQWLDDVGQATDANWRAPIWVSDPVDTATLLHDVPLRDESGKFIGAFAQIVPIAELSSFLSTSYAETGLTPFVLYDSNFVLSHPLLISRQLVESQTQPLPTIETLGDIILTRMWTPDDNELFISSVLENTKASGVFWGDHYYMYLYRDLDYYGPKKWTIGAYINTTLATDDSVEQIRNAAFAGLAILLLAVATAIYVGRKISTPVKAIADAAASVKSGKLDNVGKLGNSKVRELNDASNAFNNMVNGLREREVIRETLGRFVPEEVASSLLTGGGQIQPQQTEATILFCDIESFTQLTESLGPIKIVEVLNAYFSAMVEILERHGGVVTQFQGDAILATFNVPISNEHHAENAIRAAQEMLTCVAEIAFSNQPLSIRIGINTGPVVAGAIGAEGRLNYTVHGDAVNLAARLESLNKEYGTCLMVSGNTVALAREFTFQKVGESAVRGQTQTIALYTLDSTSTV